MLWQCKVYMVKAKFLLIILTLLLVAGLSQANEIWEIPVHQLPPYVDRDHPRQGVLTEIMTEVFSRMGVTPQYQFRPAPFCYDRVHKGKSVASFPFAQTSKRSQEVAFSHPIATSTTQFYYNKHRFKQPLPVKKSIQFTQYYKKTEYFQPTALNFINLTQSVFEAGDSEEFQPLLGTLHGAFYQDEFQDFKLRTVSTYKEKTALKWLHLQRVDLVPLNKYTAESLIRQEYPQQADDFGTLPHYVMLNSLYMVFSKKHPDAPQNLTRFNQALKELRESDLYHQILKKHGIVEIW